jgi:hypothetical protein
MLRGYLFVFILYQSFDQLLSLCDINGYSYHNHSTIYVNHTLASGPNRYLFDLLIYGVERHFQQCFIYIVAVSFIGGENRSTRRKPLTCCKSLTNYRMVVGFTTICAISAYHH